MNYLPECALRVSAVLTAAFLLTFLLRRKSASLRHLIWTTAFAVALTTPALETAGPKLLKRPMVAVHAARAGLIPAPIVIVSAAPQPAEPSSRPIAPSRQIPYAEILSGIWAAGVLAFSIRLLRGVRRVRAIRNATTPYELFEGVPVTECESAAVAMTLGIHAPMIVLPLEHRIWTPLRKQTVLLHELAHVQRRDCLLQWLPHLVCAVNWFNPLAWLARSQMLCEAERACDDAVIRGGADGPDFARDLLDLAESAGLKGTDPMLIAVTTRLERRIARLLDPSANRQALTRLRAFSASAFAFVALLPLATVRAKDDAPAPVPQTTAPTTGRSIQPGRAAPMVAPLPNPSAAPTARLVDTNGNPFPPSVRYSVIPSIKIEHNIDAKDKLTFALANPVQPTSRFYQVQTATPQTGTISGIVTDPSGARIPFATITLYGSSGQRTFASDASGTWTADLPVGSYKLEVQALGFATYDRSNVSVAPGAPLQLQQALAIGQASEMVTITAAGTPRFSPDASPPTRIGGMVTPVRAIYAPMPAYPQTLRDQGVEGAVLLNAIIGKSGNVVEARVLGDQVPPDMAQAALDAVRQWRYQPALLNGEPVETTTTVTIRFQLKP